MFRRLIFTIKKVKLPGPKKWTREEVKAMEQFMGYRSFQKEYMNNPITEGAVFKNDWVRWKKLPKLNKYEHLVAYCDPSFKSSSKNDYKAIKVWGKNWNRAAPHCRFCSPGIHQ